MENTEPKPESAEEEIVDESTLASGEEALNQMMADYEIKLGEMRELILRERAELDNQRKRLQRDLDQARKFANERLLGELLPVIDNLERGLAADKGEGSGLHAGVELTLKELLRVVGANGLVVIDPLGEPFNADHHQAMSMVESDQVESNHVVTVFQKGYVLNDRLLRPALVNVAQ
ncbi:MAG TPA: nucleotide exchange factor GrpE [Dokdonella sp.]|uniref:nucleotide exchange factor GrpE n=1 Tax=Dokdonella sp. TaxID=2291710 RepID=UPI002D7F6E92|nr:nucleotide exchange factor GrpE [Dokdonella sp.]HET9032776.1 nucleotide exchange factor GrpE [Dokdonella sp.]